MLHQRAAAVCERAVGLVAGDGREDLVEIPLALRLGGRFHLHQIHVVDHAAVVADVAVLGEEVVDRGRFHFGDHGLGLVGAGGIDGLEIVRDRRVDAGLDHGGHMTGLLEETLGEGAARIVHVPVEGLGHDHALGDAEAEAVGIGDLEQQGHQRLVILSQIEFRRLLDRVLGIASGIGEADDLGLGALRLQQEGRKIVGVERRAHCAQHVPAALLDDGRGVALERMTEGVIRGDEEPGIRAALHHGLAGDLAERVGVVSPVDAVGRAGRPGEIRGAGPRHQEDLVLVAGDLLHGERDR